MTTGAVRDSSDFAGAQCACGESRARGRAEKRRTTARRERERGAQGAGTFALQNGVGQSFLGASATRGVCTPFRREGGVQRKVMMGSPCIVGVDSA